METFILPLREKTGTKEKRSLCTRGRKRKISNQISNINWKRNLTLRQLLSLWKVEKTDLWNLIWGGRKKNIKRSNSLVVPEAEVGAAWLSWDDSSLTKFRPRVKLLLKNGLYWVWFLLRMCVVFKWELWRVWKIYKWSLNIHECTFLGRMVSTVITGIKWLLIIKINTALR